VHGDSTDGPGVSGTSATNFGVEGTSVGNDAIHGESTDAPGVHGISSTSYGVYGESDSSYAVFGISTNDIGVFGGSTSGYAVLGSSPGNIGVLGESTNDIGVFGVSTNAYGVMGYCSSGSSYAGYFDGSLYATSASASVKAFRIDHPLDPANKVLMHACVESNERKLVYDGIVTTDASGEATVELPGYFGALNTELRYQLTPIGEARAWVSAEVTRNRFSLRTDQPYTKVCWQVTGVRQDAYAKAHPLIVEAPKTGEEQGKYLNPVEHGQPESDGVTYELRQRAATLPSSRGPKAHG
jgi:hypothetical protein